ncbi:cobalt-zinc-cadmium efflux system outer membrane protein [Variovorax beijingensis]|uniref:Cobalt-zinc-cadmium efflux system outer membrane protein n=1 Tax=Variovorax beijingensis TaxID=2496117 RepID=A0A561BFV7_9BURK|nr:MULTISPECIES: TolC family protein [Variovorax]MBD9664764.1 TolC family protein [Variovorax sp. VRV01]MDR6451749.1 cobalt-zinc-cadmium efflux system outer membrane protein [Variovorax paradoxus]TWD77708.1 cobalt-zinc-cadmium efflux system outer membrane protein [Variovorax beijingensis]
MRTLFVPLAVMALAVPPAFSQPIAGSHLSPIRHTAAGTAEPAGPLDLRSALALAQQFNPGLSSASREREATDAALVQAGAWPNPVLEAQVEDLRRGNRTTTLQLSQPIELGGKRAARVTAAERARDQAASALLARRSELRASAITLFFEVLAAQERLRLAQDSVGLAEAATRAAANRVAAGKVSPLEESRARVAEAGIRVELLQAEGALRSARQQLAALWGNPNPRFTQADGALDRLPAAAGNVESRLSAAPVLRQARLEVERRQALSDLEQARRVPDVTVSLGAKRVPADEGMGSSDRNQVVVGLSVPLPIFDTNRGNVAEALSREEKARDELAAAELQLGADVAQATERLRSARATAQTLQRDALPGAEAAYKAAARGFELGKFSFLEALDAQRTLFQVRNQHLLAVADAHRAAAELDRLLGTGGEEETPHAAPAAR